MTILGLVRNIRNAGIQLNMLTTLATLAALVVALLPFLDIAIPPSSDLLIMLIGVLLAAAMLLTIPISYVIALVALQRADKALTPRLLELYRKDNAFPRAMAITFGLFLLSCAGYLFPQPEYRQYTLAVWLLLFGLTLQQLANALQSVAALLDPLKTIDRYVAEADVSMLRDPVEMLPWMDALTEVVVKGVNHSSMTVTAPALSGIHTAMEKYLRQLKRWESQASSPDKLHQLQYPLFDYLEKMQKVHAYALDHSSTMVSEQVIKQLGKVSILLAESHAGLMVLPVRLLADLTVNSGQGLDRGIVILQETLRGTVGKLKASDAQITEGLTAIIKRMYELSILVFKRDKSTPVSVLLRPFQAARELLANETLAGRPDIKAALDEVDGALEEFAALGMVMEKRAGA